MLPSRADGTGPSADGRASPGPRARGGTHAMHRLRGLYAITPDDTDADRLLDRVARVLHGGVDALQFRVKGGTPAHRDLLARAVRALTDAAGVPLVVNDDADLALAIGAAGLHAGRDDGDPRALRARLGRSRWLGVSCYDDLERARAMVGVADHVGFGAVFLSPTKPQAVRAPLALLGQARALGLGTVAIGGIDRSNAHLAIEAGADAVAVITDLFGAPDPAAAARELRTIVHRALAARPG